jgi:hypothetical protein
MLNFVYKGWDYSFWLRCYKVIMFMKKSYKENELRNRKMICCVTDEEYKEIKGDITKLGITMSEYLRRILFDKKAHLLLDSAQLVDWLDKIALESSSVTLAVRNLIQKPNEVTLEGYHVDELMQSVVSCIVSQRNIARYMKKLIMLIGNN